MPKPTRSCFTSKTLVSKVCDETLTKHFLNPFRSGIINDDTCVPGTGHAILIYGYGTATRKGGVTIDYWLCKNSWSNGWGDNGYFKMIRGKNMCGITGYLIYPTV